MALTDSGASANEVAAQGLAFGVTAGGSWRRGDVLGYSGGYVQANAAAGIRPMFVALDDSRASGDLDRKVALAAVIRGGRYAGGVAGSALYLSDTAGRVGESAGTVTYPVGLSLAVDTVLLTPMEPNTQGGLFPGPLTFSGLALHVADLIAQSDLNLLGSLSVQGGTVLKGSTYSDDLQVGGALDVLGPMTNIAGGIVSTAIEERAWRQVAVQLTNAQVLNLRATPVVLIPAPGANKTIIVHRVWMVVDAAAGAYTGANASVLEYAAGQDITESWTAIIVGAAAVITAAAGFGTGDAVGMVDLSGVTAAAANSAVRLFNSGAGEFGGGNAANSLSVLLWYSIVPTVAFT